MRRRGRACPRRCGSTAATPAPSRSPPGSVDIVLASTVFSSLLDDAFQQRLAAAMWQWLRPGGGVLWYDFTVDNPRNPDVRGVPLRRGSAPSFPRRGWRAGASRWRRRSPARSAACIPASTLCCNALPLLRTHLLCWLGKPA